jgi:hypothetical protein
MRWLAEGCCWLSDVSLRMLLLVLVVLLDLGVLVLHRHVRLLVLRLRLLLLLLLLLQGLSERSHAAVRLHVRHCWPLDRRACCQRCLLAGAGGWQHGHHLMLQLLADGFQAGLTLLSCQQLCRQALVLVLHVIHTACQVSALVPQLSLVCWEHALSVIYYLMHSVQIAAFSQKRCNQHVRDQFWPKPD